MLRLLLLTLCAVAKSSETQKCSSLVQVNTKSKRNALKGNSSAKWSVDVELVFPGKTGPGLQNSLASVDELRGICNPSLLILDDAGIVLALSRRLHMKKIKIQGRKSHAWISDIAVGRLPLQRFLGLDKAWSLEDYTMLPDPRGFAKDVNVECAPNFNLAFGPEDPKFFRFDNKTYISIVGTEMVSDPLYDIKDFLSRPNCTETQGFQHHIAELVISGSGITVRPETLVKLRTENMGTIERNWNFFTWTNPQGSQKLHAVYHVHPHIILDVDVSTGTSPRLYETTSTFLEEFARKWNLSGPEEIHSGAGIAYVSNESGSSYYISSLHFWKYNRRVWRGRNYAHFLYTFSAQPPFQITALAKKPLPLQAAHMNNWWHNETYISSMLVHDQRLIIGYGQADKSSRIYQQEVHDALQEFF